MRTFHQNINADFICKHCGYFVHTQSQVSGVVNRNHCPYCLYSKHVDLYKPGDRLSACKALMTPVGLTLKRSLDKYKPWGNGELMLVHHCINCGDISINRIAADDDPAMLLAVLSNRPKDYPGLLSGCKNNGIRLLEEKRHRQLVHNQLLGKSANLEFNRAMM